MTSGWIGTAICTWAKSSCRQGATAAWCRAIVMRCRSWCGGAKASHETTPEGDPAMLRFLLGFGVAFFVLAGAVWTVSVANGPAVVTTEARGPVPAEPASGPLPLKVVQT